MASRAWPWRALARAFRMLLLAIAGALGAPQPRFQRHEDPVVQVAEEGVPD